MPLLIRKLVIFGVGLIGGSFAFALKQQGAVGHVVGVGRSRERLEEALALGAIDSIGAADAVTLRDADLVLLATPVGQMEPLMRAIAPHLGASTVVTDGGSTKADVIGAARAHLGHRLGNIVPAHPIAGAERSGVAAAGADLYRGKRVVLTPLPETRAGALDLVGRAWEACGGEVTLMRPEDHDRVFAAVSHLPHLLAFALVHDIASRDNADQLFSFAASGFRDFTRIASSHPEMWRDICIANRNALVEELDVYCAQLAEVRAMLQQGDATGLEELFGEARSARNAWLQSLSDIN